MKYPHKPTHNIPTFRSILLKAIKYGLVTLTALFALIALADAFLDATVGTSAQKHTQKVPVVSKLAYADILSKYQKFTSLQFSEYANTIQGQYVRWSAEVVSVKKEQTTFDGDMAIVTVNLDENMGADGYLLTKDINMAAKLTYKQQIFFQGRIVNAEGTLGLLMVTLEDIEII